ncbi:DM13 domain-containing protein [Streptomyces sp. Je 1-79]|uniref:DM13 domain-containing protein n=1 Tax=Streptomyces sp. Je 1-79 TaxID=2943847 RepID=UPI0021A6AFAA|nr:DM13 domain-containing protein [Streptomyces sp. Je 1-79]MCT4357531.1 DM13 domain-containing protein [Streptomyces sp. Je 1-79]
MVAAVALAALGLYWFQPWKLWQNETVDEALPTAAPGSASWPGAADPDPGPDPSPASGPRTLAQGTLISHEHSTTGTAKLIRLADGSLTLRLEDLDTSNGPDLRVWLTDAPVKEGVAGWRVFDDGRYISLGKLKGNKGDQNYPLPPGTDPSAFTSVTIWCDRFDVSFGAAGLTA